jgi:outer membrane protein assembly factor BamE
MPAWPVHDLCEDILQMHKLLISISLASSMVLGGCGTFSDLGDAIPNALDRMPLIYRPTIQQGNVIKQEDIDNLQPGITKRQVRFLLGTPMLEDVFHQNRWDYIYTIGVGSRPKEMKTLTLRFEDDRLVRMEGDYRPLSADEQPPRDKEIVVEVPDWEGEDKGFWTRLRNSIGLGGGDT